MISNKTDFALKTVLAIASQPAGRPLTTKAMSERLNLSVSYLESILKALKAQGLIRSGKGPGGGYQMDADPSFVTVWDIAKIFETPLITSPANPHEGALVSTDFELGLQQVIERHLTATTLAELVDVREWDTPASGTSNNRFKFKPLPEMFIPRAPNSVFQLSMRC
ncbi:Rrf2 family transcriptional regulator [Limnohabitans sp. TS-CS-82]|uniref:RrF2 family transcriptional regulator n=1 Tax=Limnohabitans sp. TS-CS-82 TaxID=2094193 RepID=UPI000CF2E8D1|nr:Rrf2 family transcriptional regulator [Limnohabitans sp. TS-CS-82]PQA82600.1 Rrf2 family transcriptional regulator [Limnohabitans sp. TS-CS-82]